MTLFFGKVLHVGLRSQSSNARFLFRATSAYMPGGAILHSHAGTAATGGFLVPAPEMERACMSQLQLSMDRGMQEKATGSFPGGRPSVFTRCYKQENTMQLILANILYVHVLHCTVLCYSIHVPIHTSTITFSVVTLIGQEAPDSPPKR